MFESGVGEGPQLLPYTVIGRLTHCIEKIGFPFSTVVNNSLANTHCHHLPGCRGM